MNGCEPVRRVIVRTPNFIGDTINTTPCLELIKREYPDAEITVVGPDWVREVFKYDKRITGFITFPLQRRNKVSTFWHILLEMRKRKGDLGVLFVNTFVSALLFKLGGVQCAIGYSNEGRGFLLDFKPASNRNKHYINRYACLFNEFVGNKYTKLPELYLPLAKKETFRFENEQKVVGLFFGGEGKGCRRYPDSQAVELIRCLHKEGYNLVLVGDDDDNRKHEQYAQQSGVDHLVNLSGKTDVEGLCNTISNLDLLITIDSAALHIAAAVKTKFIGLMGLSTSPTSTITPKVPFGRILKIEHNLIREEDYIKNITPAEILRTVKELL